MYIRKHTLFSTMHPAVLFIYIWGALILAMISNHPLFAGISFVMAAACNIFYYGAGNAGKSFLTVLPFMCVIALFNLLTNHRGMVILFQIGHTPYTAESLVYGITSAVMLGAVILWFRCYTAVITNEKFLYLFGKTFPGTALLLSMIMKMFPETKYKIRCIQNAQKDIGEKRKLRKAMKQISCLLEWSMEDSIETADSMKARGYGEGRRTSYEMYRFSGSDMGILISYLLVLSLIIISIADGTMRFVYFPTFPADQMIGARQCGIGILYAVFLLSPIVMEMWDGICQFVRDRKNETRKERK